MKSIVRLKVAFWPSVVICFLPMCLTEPLFSSKANITPVKLFQINPRNISLNTRKSESFFGSKAKISRIIPIKPSILKGRPINFRNNSSSHAFDKENLATIVGNVPISKPNFQLPENLANSTSMKSQSDSGNELSTVSSLTAPSSTVSTTTSMKPETSSSKRPLFLTSDSWNYLNAVVTDDDLRQIINGLSNDVVKNVAKISKRDPISGQSFLLESIVSELNNLKQSRMLELELPKVNKGVRFSAKQRKPVLNVVPLEQKVILGKPIKNLIKTGVVEQWNISGIISNDGSNEKPFLPSTKNDTLDKESKLMDHKNGIAKLFKPSPAIPGTTTPSLMQVLAVPERLSFDSTTYSPFASNQLKSGFIPLIPTNSGPSAADQSFMYREKVKSKENEISEEENLSVETDSPLLADASTVVVARKPRVSPKEDEYSIPSITSTSTTSPEGNKGYQTISESTTPGPKVIWYNHNQTPEDTFYPNSDPFLVPPEESSIEILSDLLSVQPVPDGALVDTKVPFSQASSELTFKYDRSKSKMKGSRKIRPVLHYSSKENGDDVGNRSAKGSRFSIVKDKKKSNKIVALQQAAATDHGGIRDYYEELDGKNGGSSGEGNVYYHHKKKRYGPESYNSYSTNDIKDHEIIIPRHQRTNRKPPYSEYDTESYGAYNEDDHYRDSYPPPPDANRHEISPHRYRSPHESTDENEYFKDEPIRVYDSGNNGPYRDEGPAQDVDGYYKKEPKYRPKANSPGWGKHGHDHQGHGNHGHGWNEKGPSGDFFSKAKDYFKNSDLSTAQKWFDVTIGLLAFLAFGGYIIMLLCQVFMISSGTPVATLLGRSVRGAGEMFDLFFSKGPIGHAYLDELETIVKRAMANVKRIWVTNSFADKTAPKVKGEVDSKR